jgi:hypothetical protein
VDKTVKYSGFWIVVALLLVIHPATAQQTTTTISPALNQQLDLIEAITSDIRGLKVLTPVSRNFPTRDQVKQFLQQQIDEQLTPAVTLRETQFYVAFDLLPANYDLRQSYVTLLGSQVAGYYDPDTQKMNVIPLNGKLGDQLALIDQITYSHEFTHAMQDQHFGLNKLGITDASNAGDNDRALAVQALVEGDATFVMQAYLLRVSQDNPLGAAAQILLSGAASGSLTLPPNTPPILQAELLFPYLPGMNFVSTLYNDGGWAAVDAVYSDLPQSTEQIMHPEKYQRHDNPVTVTFKSDDSVLGSGWQPLIDRTLGEFYLQQYLLTQLPSVDAAQAAAGWGGDRFHLFYEATTHQRAWVLHLVWDTPSDGDEFNVAYQKFADKRFGTKAASGCWSNAASAIVLVTGAASGGDWVSEAPTCQQASTLIDAQATP